MPLQVYIETTVPSYLTARPSRDLIQAARQELTREWWDQRRAAFDLCTSQLVLDEVAQGDPDVAERRLALLRGLALLPIEDPAIRLAQGFVSEGLLPPRAAADALHIAIATAHELDVLLTWNCRHLANAEILGGLRVAAQRHDYQLPIICTPEELMGSVGEE